MEFTKEDLNLENGLEKEWLITMPCSTPWANPTLRVPL